METVRSVPNVTEGEEWKELDSGQGFVAANVWKEVDIEEVRKDPEALRKQGNELKRTLTKVRDKIIDLSKELRTLRSQLEAEEEGRGS